MKINLLKKFISVFGKKRKTVIKQLINWKSFQKDIQYKIKDKEKFVSSVLHTSYSNITNGNDFESYERLEFLGDAVLELVIGEFLFRRFPEKSEGELTQIRSVFASRKVIAKRAQELNLGKYIILGPGEEKTGGREKESLLSDIFESILGAIYLERGLNAARKFVEKNVFNEYQFIISGSDVKNYKGELIEYCQQNHFKIPRYIIKEQKGFEHHKIYTIEVKIGEKFFGSGEGTTKKEAEQRAAAKALENLKLN